MYGTHRVYRDGRRASTVDGAADHRRQNLHQRRLNESVLSQYRRQLTELLREIQDTKVCSGPRRGPCGNWGVGFHRRVHTPLFQRGSASHRLPLERGEGQTA